MTAWVGVWIPRVWYNQANNSCLMSECIIGWVRLLCHLSFAYPTSCTFHGFWSWNILYPQIGTLSILSLANSCFLDLPRQLWTLKIELTWESVRSSDQASCAWGCSPLRNLHWVRNLLPVLPESRHACLSHDCMCCLWFLCSLLCRIFVFTGHSGRLAFSSVAFIFRTELGGSVTTA